MSGEYTTSIIAPPGHQALRVRSQEIATGVHSQTICPGEQVEAREGIEPPIRALQALPLAVLGTAPQSCNSGHSLTSPELLPQVQGDMSGESGSCLAPESLNAH